MTYHRIVPKVILAHVVILGLFLLVPLIRSCSWFKKPPLETIEIDLSSLPPPPANPDPVEPEEQEEEPVIPQSTPRPTAQPTARPTVTPTPAPQATAVPTATPRPLPTSTPTPKPRYLTPEEIRRRIEQQQNAPEPLPTQRPLSAEELAELMGQGLPEVSNSTVGVGGGTSAGGASLAGVDDLLYNKLFAAWDQPTGLSSLSRLTAEVEVVVSREGRVRSARIVRSSENTEFDRTVQVALSSVTFAKPLPAEYNKDTTTFTYIFQLTE